MPLIEQPNLSMLDAPAPLAEACMNFNSGALLQGQLVARDEAITDTDAYVQRAKRYLGAAAPASANAHRLWGILQCNNRKTLAQNEQGSVVAGGLCQALVKVPATTAINEGSLLVPETGWDGTNHNVTFGYTLVPVIINAVVIQPPNPFAILRETIASGSARTVTAWVEVYPFHKPLPFCWHFSLGTAAAALADMFINAALGPGVLDTILGTPSAVPTAASLAINVYHAPLQGSVDQVAMLSTAIKMDSAGSPLVKSVMGLGYLTTGTSVGFLLGTAGSNGVKAALLARQFGTNEVIALTTVGAATAAVNLMCSIQGLYY
jgi:hypothetical protein